MVISYPICAAMGVPTTSLDWMHLWSRITLGKLIERCMEWTDHFQWLVRHERYDEAAVVVRRLMSKKEAHDENSVQNTLSMMKLTNEHEKALSEGTQYWDCFRGIDLRRTEVACFTWACQNLCGYVTSTPCPKNSLTSNRSAFMGFSTYFYKQVSICLHTPASLSFVTALHGD
jgi:hypothetical protein